MMHPVACHEFPDFDIDLLDIRYGPGPGSSKPRSSLHRIRVKSRFTNLFPDLLIGVLGSVVERYITVAIS